MPNRNLASRSASRKLATILAILLFPAAALLYLFAAKSIGEIRQIQLQIEGVKYLAKVSPVFDALTKGNRPGVADAGRLREVPEALSLQRAEIVMDVQNVSAALDGGETPDGALIWQLRILIQDATLASDLSLAKARDTQLLADAATKTLPDFAILARRAAIGNEHLSEGEFTAARNATFADVSEAVKSDDAQALAGLLNDKLAKHYVASDMFLAALQEQDDSRYTSAATELLAVTSDLQHATNAALANKLGMALASLKWNLYCSLALVGLAMLTAIGFAAHLMARTFLELDKVESARKASEKSAFEAKVFAEEMQRLNHEIAGLNKDLSANYKMLEAAQADNIQKSKMAQLGALTAMVAHELRNPLGAIRNTAFLVDAMSKKIHADFSKQISRIELAVGRCDRIIGQLLDYASSREVKPAEIAASTWLMQTIEAEAKTLPGWLTITLDDLTENISVFGDAGKLSQCIHNIFKNAVQAMEPVATTQRGTISQINVTATVQKGTFELVISDTGPGIPADKIEVVTEPMFTTKSFGPGLGLAYVEQVIKLHGGNLKITSTVGSGTQIQLSLPQVPSQATAA